MSDSPSPWKKQAWLALGLSLLFVFVSFLPLLLQYQFLFHGDKVLNSVVDVPLLGTKLGGQIGRFVLGQIVVCAAFAACIWILAYLSDYGFKPKNSRPHQLILLWFLLLAATVFVANAYLFPWSSSGEFFWEFLSVTIAGIALGPLILCGGLSAITIILLRALVRMRPRNHLSREVIACALVVLVALPAVAAISSRATPHASAAAQSRSQPNIILIGVDSLRPDFTALGGDAVSTPHISAFIKQARAFTDVTTPLARTFPAWISILTGRHPHDTGALINLTNRADIDAFPTLADTFRAQGYRTVFAIDEVRFANIDHSYGFDQLITPPMGAADFLLGTLNDAPLTNLLANTAIGRLLFPNAYANRAAAHVYYPEQFTARLKAELDFSKPLFLAAHFTLPHYPYHWASAPKVKPDGSFHHGQSLYGETVKRADRQVGQLLKHLEDSGALRNAIVVVLSDHGEGLGRENDLWVTTENRKFEDYTVPAAKYGHGTSVLNAAQYQVVLAMRGYGEQALAKVAPGLISQPASLEDIAPTLLDLTDSKLDNPEFSGRSMAAAVRGDGGQAVGAEMRVRFAETEFNPPALLAGFDFESEIARQSAQFYHVDPITGLVQVRESMRSQIMAERQYAAEGEHYVLAAIPTAAVPYRFVLASRDRITAQLIKSPADLDGKPEGKLLWDALHARFPLAVPQVSQAEATIASGADARDTDNLRQ